MDGGYAMSIERSELREDLVAVIAAGRELSPQHDYVLADVFLDRIRRDAVPQQRTLGWLDDPHRLRTLLAAACLALAVLLVPLMGAFASHGGAATTGPVPVQRSFDPDGPFAQPGPWWHDDDQGDGAQFP